MLMILGTFRLPADKMDAGRPAMTRMVEASRAEDGCVEYVFAEDVADPGSICHRHAAPKRRSAFWAKLFVA